MILADTSAWIEFLRATRSSTHAALRDAISTGEVCTTDVVYLELLAGARSERERAQLQHMLDGVDYQQVWARDDWERAASLFSECRSHGLTVRGLLDCLVAAVAIRLDVPVLHHDRDLATLARVTPLRVAAGSGS